MRHLHNENHHRRHGPDGERHHAHAGHEHHGRGHGRGGRGDRGSRIFDHGTLRFLLLHLIAEQPRHGYELIKAIGGQMNGEYSPSPGVVYPTLTLLEEEGHLTGAESGGRKLYTITEAGTALLEANQPVIAAMQDRMSSIAGQAQRPAPVIRAVENLRLALQLRLNQGQMTPDQANTVATILDNAAQAIERS